MRWNIKQHNYEDTRTIKKFLWFPILIDDELRWLETALIEQQYSFMGWENIRWCND